MSGYWSPITSDFLYPAMGQVFAANTDLYVQFAYRISPEFVQNIGTMLGQGTAPKLSIFYYGQTCASLELTTTIGSQNIGGGGLGLYPAPGMYKECGAGHMYTALDGQTYTENTPLLLQQGDYACQYAVGPLDRCWQFPTNKWVTLDYKIHIGDWGVANSTIEVSYSVDGQPYLKWINVVKNFTINKEGSYPGLAQIMFTPYATSLSRPMPVTSRIWDDELIVSTQPIAAPAISSGGITSPIQPTNLTVK